MSGYILGLDVGTTATKAILLDPNKGIIAETQEPANLYSPEAGWAEEDPQVWWSNVPKLVHSCLAQAQAKPDQIIAIGVSGMVPTVILLDAKGSVLYPSIQQNDARAYREIEEMQSHISEEEALEQTGSAITSQSVGPKLLWLKTNKPDLFSQAAHVMGSYDYIVYKLTGEFSSERNWALESGLFDLVENDWIDSFLSLCGTSKEYFGKVHWPSEVVGQITAEAAEYSGLPLGTPVVAGSADHIASAFSAGLKSPGDLLVKLGGAGDILLSMDQLIVDKRLFLDYHVIPGKYFLNGCMASSGSIIKWFKNEFAPISSYEELDKEGLDISPGCDGLILLPYFIGEKTPINDPSARGVFFGLSLTHHRAHLYRAILEGISFGFLHHIKIFAERGLTLKKVRVTNGGARSVLWKQISADVLGLPLEQIAHHPGSSLGAAFVAGKGVGAISSWEDIENYIQIERVVEPDMSSHKLYQELFEIYQHVYQNLKTDFVDLRQVLQK